jgi:hypothetical protein
MATNTVKVRVRLESNPLFKWGMCAYCGCSPPVYVVTAGRREGSGLCSRCGEECERVTGVDDAYWR